MTIWPYDGMMSDMTQLQHENMDLLHISEEGGAFPPPDFVYSFAYSWKGGGHGALSRNLRIAPYPPCPPPSPFFGQHKDLENKCSSQNPFQKENANSWAKLFVSS